MEKQLCYVKARDAFVVFDKAFADSKDDAAAIALSAKDYEILGLIPLKDNAPRVGVLFGRGGGGYYTVDSSVVYAVVKSGMQPVFLDYENYKEQLEGCCGVILCGDGVQFPSRYFDDFSLQKGYPNRQIRVFAEVLAAALKKGIPILGINAGALVIAAEFGALLYQNVTLFKNRVNHYSRASKAHLVRIVPKTMLADLMLPHFMTVNSHHREAVISLPVWNGLRLYAEALDGVPEAWGSERDKILAVQWMPERLVMMGGIIHERVFDWLAVQCQHGTFSVY